VITEALKAKPADMAITTHVCRGNFRSTWISEGGYEPVAEILLGQLNYDGYFLEYDSGRAGGLEPLRFLPKGNKQVVVGLVTSKSGTLGRKMTWRRLEEAWACPAESPASPAVRLASTRRATPTEEQQWASWR
jgi:5-methyltetrahydropteroyltriglutamate--homocysteine methyltransferase